MATTLQSDQAPRLTWIQTTCAGGVRARLRRVAGCATPSGSAGHAGETANLELTFHLDHSAGADHFGVPEVILLSLRIRAHVLRRHQPSVVSEHLQLAAEMMRTHASFHAD